MPENEIRTYHNAVAIVTGGASGIGQALSMELAWRGAYVALADLQMDEAQEVARQISQSGGKADAVGVDVTDYPAMQQAVRDVAARAGRLDYLFSNAGIAVGGSMDDFDIGDWNRIIDVNLRGVVHGVNAAYPVMKKQGYGHLVNTASMAGLMPNPLNIPYTASKHAVVGLSQSLRAEVAHLGIRVSVVCPGVIITPILDGGKYGAMKMKMTPEKQQELWKKMKPMAPEAFARKVLWAVAKNKAVIIAPAFWKLIWWLNRLSPALGVAFARNRYAQLRQECNLE